MRTPISTEARGRLRRWRAEQLIRCDHLPRMLKAAATQDAVRALVAPRNSAKGRHRAFIKLHRKLAPYAHFQGVRLEGPYPLALWAVLRPRGAVIIEGRDDDPGSRQDCIAVEYLLIGRMRGANFAAGLWTLEISDHTLGRLLQRSPATDPETLLLATHHRVQQLRDANLLPALTSPRHSFLLPAGPGVFVCELVYSIDADDKGFETEFAYVRARTFLDGDQLDAEQEKTIVLADDKSSEPRLGDSVFLPLPLRQFVKLDDGGVDVDVWGGGLPRQQLRTGPSSKAADPWARGESA